MGLKFKIKSGALQGREYSISHGAVIGRSSVEISIDDAKMSGRHAKIEKSSSGSLYLVDLGSTNGLRVGGEKLTQVKLTPGLIVKIGNTDFEIMREDDNSPPAIPEPKPNLAPKQKSWSDFLSEFSLRATAQIKNKPQEILPFNPLLILTVTHGLQSGQEWILGYGPRQVGAAALDFHLFDNEAPSLAFTVEPAGSQARYFTSHPQKVFLNGRAVSSEMLNAGDEITLASTIIKVSYKT